jgi:hypothetical protein
MLAILVAKKAYEALPKNSIIGKKKPRAGGGRGAIRGLCGRKSRARQSSRYSCYNLTASSINAETFWS